MRVKKTQIRKLPLTNKILYVHVLFNNGDNETLDWPLAITRNQEALRRIVAAMFAMLRENPGSSPLSVGFADTVPGRATDLARPSDPQRGEVMPAAAPFTSPRVRAEVSRAQPVTERGLPPAKFGSAVFTLPYRIYAAILLILRPAESAVRRLIIIAARGLILKPQATRQNLPNFPAFAAMNSARIPQFALLDPLKHFSLEDFNQNSNPHVSFSSSWDPSDFAPSLSQPDEPVNAALLFSRMRALRAALSDLPKQARRLARWQARRDELLRSKSKPTRISIFRPGLPPGWRQRSIHDVDDVLRECHGLAIYAVNGPDTG